MAKGRARCYTPGSSLVDVRLAQHPGTMLDIWPVFPLAIRVGRRCRTKNIFAALEHRDRICRISVDHNAISPLHPLLSVMQEQFSALTFLSFSHFMAYRMAHIPDSFLGGSTPHLRYLHLKACSYPALPELLLSAATSSLFTFRKFLLPGTFHPR